MLTVITIFLPFLLILLVYTLISVYPAIIIHCLEDSRRPYDIKDFLKMTYLPYLFECRRKGLPY